MSSSEQYRCSLQHIQNAREKWQAHRMRQSREREQQSQSERCNSNNPMNENICKNIAPESYRGAVSESNSSISTTEIAISSMASDTAQTNVPPKPVTQFASRSLGGQSASATAHSLSFSSSTSGSGAILNTMKSNSQGAQTDAFVKGSNYNTNSKSTNSSANPFTTLARSSCTPFSFSTSTFGSGSIFDVTISNNAAQTGASQNDINKSALCPSTTSVNPFAASSFGESSTNTTCTPFSLSSSSFGGEQTTVSSAEPAPTVESGQRDDTNDYKAKLIKFYEQHNQSKLSTVDATLDKYKSRENELFAKLYQKYGLSPDATLVTKFAEPSGCGPKVFMDLSVGGKQVGRIVMQLYADKTPLAAENFRALCTGTTTDECGAVKNLRRTYAGNIFHRVVPGFVIQGGDITQMNGTGGTSIYPPSNPNYGTDAWGKFRDETPFMQHSKRGLLSMANNGPNRNGSQFFITLKAAPFLDGKHVVFGEVLEPKIGVVEEMSSALDGEGMNVIDRIIDLVEVDPKNHRPRDSSRVVIEKCGEVIL
ncbi:hypothetical protein HJC23_007924 [Cyclotella cryptica]|uniref:peptidylprolyl isomerase n=1 Tax=Cyclotella cryptica TaxID=29204 RepID=A0ABD3NZQ1_9STRA|eukprot:CCRYP_018777-RA/>CCRYP_018777-RA protein AED:0.02 eAED:0.02 QI:128/1/1/1/1/1/2/119/536